MNRQIVIGKEGTQPFAIHDPKVSRRHATLYIDETTQVMTLVDNGSTNGTYVYNGTSFVRLCANQPYTVTSDSMIQLGPDTRFHVRRLLASSSPAQVKTPPKPQKPKRVDIKPLRRISERYNNEKMELESKTATINGLRSCTIIVSMAVGVVPQLMTSKFDFGENGAFWVAIISIGLGVILLVGLLILINRFNKKLISRRNKNEHDYAVKYCCPECGVSFRGKIYENILSERKCPKCKTEYYES